MWWWPWAPAGILLCACCCAVRGWPPGAATTTQRLVVAVFLWSAAVHLAGSEVPADTVCPDDGHSALAWDALLPVIGLLAASVGTQVALRVVLLEPLLLLLLRAGRPAHPQRGPSGLFGHALFLAQVAALQVERGQGFGGPGAAAVGALVGACGAGALGGAEIREALDLQLLRRAGMGSGIRAGVVVVLVGAAFLYADALEEDAGAGKGVSGAGGAERVPLRLLGDLLQTRARGADRDRQLWPLRAGWDWWQEKASCLRRGAWRMLDVASLCWDQLVPAALLFVSVGLAVGSLPLLPLGMPAGEFMNLRCPVLTCQVVGIFSCAAALPLATARFQRATLQLLVDCSLGVSLLACKFAMLVAVGSLRDTFAAAVLLGSTLGFSAGFVAPALAAKAAEQVEEADTGPALGCLLFLTSAGFWAGTQLSAVLFLCQVRVGAYVAAGAACACAWLLARPQLGSAGAAAAICQAGA